MASEAQMPFSILGAEGWNVASEYWNVASEVQIPFQFWDLNIGICHLRFRSQFLFLDLSIRVSSEVQITFQFWGSEY